MSVFLTALANSGREEVGSESRSTCMCQSFRYYEVENSKTRASRREVTRAKNFMRRDFGELIRFTARRMCYYNVCCSREDRRRLQRAESRLSQQHRLSEDKPGLVKLQGYPINFILHKTLYNHLLFKFINILSS